METNYTLEEILWRGFDYDKGLCGKKILVLGYYYSNVKIISDKEYINDNKFRRLAEYMGTLFCISQIDFIKRIAYINLCNEKERRKEDFENLIISLNPDIVIACGVNLRQDIFINKNIISYDDDLYYIVDDSNQDENCNVGYIHRLVINGTTPKLLLTSYSLYSNNYKFPDNGKLAIFMKICCDNENYKIIINSKPKELIRIKTTGLSDKPFNLTLLSE